ncbi:Fe-S cluster assembly protein SufD [Oceanobacillus chungangensis]|uniref:Fe-S cluster assembly protein SufD n=1 Tax=Oceanobacillus chungangensis TaxID=1229152 RepID=A0A3D8PXR1_9BACI|nr:Fe-S cluster assembly protein SufD [Oceanobacillus chungangensis]RDW20936.1 Fe-S cluster assembly protein SufD [Oceanobacillus chungangensis]
MTVETKLPYNREYIEQFSKDRNEPEWVKSLRLQALEQAEILEMPKPDKTKITRWNFSNFKHEYTKGEAITSIEDLPKEIQDYFDEKNIPENLLIQRNHSVAFATLSEELKEKGVIFTDIFTALQNHSKLVEKYFMKDAVSVDQNKLTALHAALFNGGAFLYVPKNVEIEDPLQVIFWQEDPELALVNHVIVVADENSKLTYVENYISNNEEQETVANIITEVIALDNASISFGAVDNFAAGTTSYVNRRGIAYRNASIDWALGQMNDGNTVSENITHLIGDGSTSKANAVSVGRGKQIQNFTASIDQHGKATDGFILQRGVMKEKATMIFNAIGKIEHGGKKANSEQESRVLMLSPDARGDANPILLIEEDDVTAGHAASVGRVDPMQMYYLKSRGLTTEEAERLIIHGFLAPVVDQLPIESVKNQLKQVIERKVN